MSTNKKNIKKRAVKKKTAKRKTSGKIDFLTKRKTIDDKFFDVVESVVKKEYNKKKKKWEVKGISKLAKELEILPKTLQKYIDEGGINKKNDSLFINVERNFDKLKGLSKTVKKTKEFSIHNFTKSNFFEKKNLGKTKWYEQYYFRCGLKLTFKRPNKYRSPWGKKSNTYVMQNVPISYYSKNYNSGYNEFFNTIKIKLQEFPSLHSFQFNYFDVQKIDTRKI